MVGGVEIKLVSFLGFAVNRHVRCTPGAPGLRGRDKHVEETHRTPSHHHRRGGRLQAGAAAASIVRRLALHRGGDDGRGAAVREALLSHGALEGGLYLLEGADALVH